jgi:hypothetical protein
MGLLTEPDFDRLVAAGCAVCGATKLMFRTYVDGAIPMVGGEPVGRITWVYDGESSSTACTRSGAASATR